MKSHQRTLEDSRTVGTQIKVRETWALHLLIIPALLLLPAKPANERLSPTKRLRLGTRPWPHQRPRFLNNRGLACPLQDLRPHLPQVWWWQPSTVRPLERTLRPCCIITNTWLKSVGDWTVPRVPMLLQQPPTRGRPQPTYCQVRHGIWLPFFFIGTKFFFQQLVREVAVIQDAYLL